VTREELKELPRNTPIVITWNSMTFPRRFQTEWLGCGEQGITVKNGMGQSTIPWNKIANVEVDE
jgi:hypothetical protein